MAPAEAVLPCRRISALNQRPIKLNRLIILRPIGWFQSAPLPLATIDLKPADMADWKLVQSVRQRRTTSRGGEGGGVGRKHRRTGKSNIELVVAMHRFAARQ